MQNLTSYTIKHKEKLRSLLRMMKAYEYQAELDSNHLSPGLRRENEMYLAVIAKKLKELRSECGELYQQAEREVYGRGDSPAIKNGFSDFEIEELISVIDKWKDNSRESADETSRSWNRTQIFNSAWR